MTTVHSSAINGSITSSKLDIARQGLANHLCTLSQQLRTEHQIELTFPSEIDILNAAPSSHVYASTVNSNDEVAANVFGFEEGEGYRCKCTFQIVCRSSLTTNEQTSPSPIDGDEDLIYVTREDGNICPLPNGIFPPANRRIRCAMVDLMNCLNRKLNMNNDGISSYTFTRLRDNLTSATFVTSWGDGPIMQQQSVSENSTSCSSCHGGDFLVTLHYGPPGLPTNNDDEDCTDELQEWKNEAKAVCDQGQFTILTGRSKGFKVSVSGQRNDALTDHDSHDKAMSEEGVIHDDLWLTLRDLKHDNSQKIVEVDRVTLVPPNKLQSTETSSTIHNRNLHEVCIHYQKPATAFQHPNAGVMLTSLHWILNVLSKIAKQRAAATTDASIRETKPSLLEMYCGCGAHTLPLAKSTFLSNIVAVELDERLVNACRNNCRLNNCLKDDNSNSEQSNSNKTLVEVVKGDATEWADKTLRRQRKQQNTKCDDYNKFDILLVDPPRDGLSSTVCGMVLKGTFTHLIYVSCGRRALLRDLTLLCGGNEEGFGFDVMHLAVIDLFPGTDAVESLVHLQRRD